VAYLRRDSLGGEPAEKGVLFLAASRQVREAAFLFAGGETR